MMASKGRPVPWNPIAGIDSFCADVEFSFRPPDLVRPRWHLTVRLYFSFVRGNPAKDMLLEFEDAVAFRWEDECFGADSLPDGLPLIQGPVMNFTFPLLVIEESPWIERLAGRHPVQAEGKTHYAFTSLNGMAEAIAGPPIRVEWVPSKDQT